MIYRNKYNCSLFTAATSSFSQMGKIFWCLWLLVFPFVFATDRTIDCGPMVSLKWGILCGKLSTTANGKETANFLGIPYALPPIDNLRFKNPQPWNLTWNGLRDSTFSGSECIGSRYVESHSEDCLFLNVHVPEILKLKEKRVHLPVLVLLNGVEYLEGNGDSKLYNPDYLLDKDMVLVTVNYRMNIFGFFSTMNEASPGNYGLKDIVMALKWIQDNIVHFNGDANSVTLMGNSVSSAMVHLLALSKKTEGLFHKYILISGSALSSWNMHSYDWINYSETCLKAAFSTRCLSNNNVLYWMLRESAIIPTETIKPDDIYNSFVDSCENLKLRRHYEKMMNCLRTTAVEELVSTTLYYLSLENHQKYVFGPTLEAESEDAILTMHPIKILKEGLFRDIPVLVLVMEDEGLSLISEIVTRLKNFRNVMEGLTEELIATYFKPRIDFFLNYKVNIINDTNTFATEIENFYFNESLAANFMRNITEMIGDGAIRWPMFKAIQHHSNFGNSSIYLFNLAYKGTFSFTVCRSYSNPDYCNDDEIETESSLLKYPKSFYQLQDEQNEHFIINVMTNLLGNFTRDGIPKADQMPPIVDYRNSSEFVKIGNGDSTDITVEIDFFTNRMNFWDDVMPKVLDKRNVDLYKMLIASGEE